MRGNGVSFERRAMLAILDPAERSRFHYPVIRNASQADGRPPEQLERMHRLAATFKPPQRQLRGLRRHNAAGSPATASSEVTLDEISLEHP
jgi:hypothetical protein